MHKYANHLATIVSRIIINILYCSFSRPPSGADPGHVHMKYDAVNPLTPVPAVTGRAKTHPQFSCAGRNRP